MQKKRILFVIHSLSVGGAQKSMINAINKIDFEEYDVELYVRKNKTNLINEIDNRVKITINYKFDFYHDFTSKLKSKFGFSKPESLSDSIADRKIINEKKWYFSSKKKYDIAVCYVNGYTTKFVIDAIPAEKKIVFYLGSSDPLPQIHKVYLPKFDRIVCDSEGTFEFLVNSYPVIKGKTTIIHNYIDFQRVRINSLSFDIDNPSCVCLSSCGRLVSLKGYDMAVEAANILKKKRINFIWYFVGDGPEREKIELLINKYELNDNIIITGLQQNPYPYIAKSNIYVQPSYEESYGLTITEAKILCRPVVSTDTVGAREQIIDGKTGVITEFTPESLAEGILDLINDKKLYNSIENELEGIDYSKSEDDYVESWKKLLEG